MDIDRIKRIEEVAQALYERMDFDPAGAVAEASALEPAGYLNQADVDSLQAGVFVDGGTLLKDPDTVTAGVDLLRKLTERNPDRLDLSYNLANGLNALAQLKQSEIPWYLATSDLRREARACFEAVGSAAVSSDLKGRARTNHANLLNQSHRWLEAYELYRQALAVDPKNAVASSGAAKVLLQAADRGFGPPAVLRSLAVRYLQQTRLHQQELTKYAGPDALKALRGLPSDLEVETGWPPDLSSTDEFTRFVGHNHLALSLTIEGLNRDLKRWDSLSIRSIREDMRAPHGVPAIFAMFNVLRADYLAARWLVYQAIRDKAPETGSYSDTLDYATYGIREGLLTLAQRSVIDILDRIAVAASEYLALPGSPSSIYFWKRWHVNAGRGLKTPLEWQPEVQKEIEAGNAALIALSEIAEDIAAGGYLAPQRTLRNASTHRFVVLHDLGVSPSRESRFVEHFDANDFEAQTVSALRLVRSALVYFVEMIAIREARLEREGGWAGSLHVPDHHRIRGDDEANAGPGIEA